MFQVYEHKEARHNKDCPIMVSGETLADLQIYARRVWRPKDDTSKHLFLTESGVQISPSVSG
jgi:hypothetical protein